MFLAFVGEVKIHHPPELKIERQMTDKIENSDLEVPDERKI
jgi:hypothetical protein